MVKLAGKIKKIFDAELFGNFEKRIMWLEETAAESQSPTTKASGLKS